MARAVVVISYDQPEETNEAIAKLADIADKVRDLFTDAPDLKVNIAIRESAQAVLDVFEG